MSAVILDCTELYQNPVRTGIQRVVRELLRHWPSDGPELHVARFDATMGLVAIPEAAVKLLTDDHPGTDSLGHEELIRTIAYTSSVNRSPRLPLDATIFLPEVFYDPARCEFYSDHITKNRLKIALLAYDFIPILYPWIFKLRSSAPFMHYVHLVQRIEHLAHISERTRREYANRIMRGQSTSTGQVLALGADGIRLERQIWSEDRCNFIALGSLDGWKNQDVIISAFVEIWKAGYEAPLALIGRAYDGVDLSWLAQARSYKQFRWLSNATDEDVSNEMRKARATIYIPDLAGFGLPPIESLYAGIPVITLADMPSLDSKPANGQVRIERPETDLLVKAITDVLDRQIAAKLWKEASEINLNRWQDFASSTAAWLDQV